MCSWALNAVESTVISIWKFKAKKSRGQLVCTPLQRLCETCLFKSVIISPSKGNLLNSSYFSGLQQGCAGPRISRFHVTWCPIILLSPIAVFVYNDVIVSSIGFPYHWKYIFYMVLENRRWFNKSTFLENIPI